MRLVLEELRGEADLEIGERWKERRNAYNYPMSVKPGNPSPHFISGVL
jgi:hypothetical protein